MVIIKKISNPSKDFEGKNRLTLLGEVGIHLV